MAIINLKAVVSGIVNLAIFGTGMSIACNLQDKFSELKSLGGMRVIALLSTTGAFFAFAAGNKAAHSSAKCTKLILLQ